MKIKCHYCNGEGEDLIPIPVDKGPTVYGHVKCVKKHVEEQALFLQSQRNKDKILNSLKDVNLILVAGVITQIGIYVKLL